MVKNRYQIRLSSIDDSERYSRYYQKNQSHLSPWEQKRPEDYHDVAAWKERLMEYEALREDDRAYHFNLKRDKDDAISGVCSISGIIRSPFEACYMSCSVSFDCEGKGMAQHLCRYVIDFAFDHLKLHRIMANHMPANKRSKRLLHRLGFEREGFAKDYLKINGVWEDHVLTSLINNNL